MNNVHKDQTEEIYIGTLVTRPKNLEILKGCSEGEKITKYKKMVSLDIIGNDTEDTLNDEELRFPINQIPENEFYVVIDPQNGFLYQKSTKDPTKIEKSKRFGENDDLVSLVDHLHSIVEANRKKDKPTSIYLFFFDKPSKNRFKEQFHYEGVQISIANLDVPDHGFVGLYGYEIHIHDIKYKPQSLNRNIDFV